MTAVFLDLDGTLSDSRPGIVAALTHAMRVTGHDHLAETDLTWMIGPPFSESFPQAGIERIEEVTHAYRAQYETGGLFDTSAYDGIGAALAALSDRRLYLATAKPHVHARRVTAHLGLNHHFVEEFGPEADGTRSHKSDLLAHALTVTGERADRAVMVGDRSHDAEAAAHVGMPFIAVTWGYGTPVEWTSAAEIVDHPSALPAAVSRVLD